MKVLKSAKIGTYALRVSSLFGLNLLNLLVLQTSRLPDVHRVEALTTVADRDYDHTYLALRRPTYASRTFLGGLKLSTRTGLFVTVGLLAIMVYAGLIVHVNDRVSVAQLGLERARDLNAE